MKRAFVTGTAGFIGFHVAQRLLAEGWAVTGFDGMADQGDQRLKQDRHAGLRRHPAFHGVEAMLEDAAMLQEALRRCRPEVVIHLAAQTGVRHSIEHPRAHLQSNITGTFNLLEAMQGQGVAHLLIASSSSVYGASTDLPFREDHNTDRPISFYAATKKSIEAMAHAWAHSHGQPTTAFRFFTVYGPWGRPDMAVFKFTRAILAGQPIDVYNNGEMARDFTYIDDLVTAIGKLIDVAPGGPASDGQSSVAPFRVVNVGHAQPVKLDAMIAAIERATGRTAIRNALPMQAGDVPMTWSDTSLLSRLTGYAPGTPIEEGVRRFVDWYRDYYGGQTA